MCEEALGLRRHAVHAADGGAEHGIGLEIFRAVDRQHAGELGPQQLAGVEYSELCAALAKRFRLALATAEATLAARQLPGIALIWIAVIGPLLRFWCPRSPDLRGC